MTFITPKEGGRGVPRGRVPFPTSWFLVSKTNSFKYPALLIALNDLSAPYIVQWYTLYPYDKCSTSFDFSLMGYPPFCSANGSMAHS